MIALYTEDSKEAELDDNNANNEEVDEQQPFSKNAMTAADTTEQSSIEKVLHLVEKMASSEGVYRKIKKGDLSNTIKCSLMDKKDLLEMFRSKYQWYFRSRYQEQGFQQKKKNFQEIMEMSSIITEGS